MRFGVLLLVIVHQIALVIVHQIALATLQEVGSAAYYIYVISSTANLLYARRKGLF